MKIPTAAFLCVFFPKITEGILPFGDVLNKIASTKTARRAFETTDPSTADASITFENAKAFLMTVPTEGNIMAADMDEVASPEGAALEQAVHRARDPTIKNKFASVLGATSPTQWAMLLSSMAPISLLEKIVGAVVGKSLSLDNGIVRAVLQEYQVVARVAVTTMSLPPQFTKSIWIAYFAVKAFPQRSLIVSLLVSAAVVLRAGDLPGRLSGQGFNNMAAPYRSQVPALLVCMSLLSLVPLLFSGVRSVGIFTRSTETSPFILSDCLLTPEDLNFPAAKPMVQSDAAELRTSLASVSLNRLIAAPSTEHLWKESRYYEYTKPALELWRIGTSVQFWQSIYHAVKHDEYYCLLEDEREPVAIA